jgi:hypothetical protein
MVAMSDLILQLEEALAEYNELFALIDEDKTDEETKDLADKFIDQLTIIKGLIVRLKRAQVQHPSMDRAVAVAAQWDSARAG